MENSDNPEKNIFPDYQDFQMSEEKKWNSELDSAGQKNFINASLVREITANPEDPQ